VSRERARRRELRQVEAARRAAAQAARSARQLRLRRRRQRWRAAARSVLPWRPGQRWSRRTRAQRAAIVGVLLGIAVLTVLVTPSWSIRIAVALAALVATPALVTLFLDRSTR
jgi:uncharacterized protein (UPF0548 family)